MRRLRGGGAAALALATLAACRPAPPPSGFTLLFLGRSPTAQVESQITWAPDPDRSRLVAFDSDLRIVRTIADPRLATPMAVARLAAGRLLVTERTGEGVVFDVAGPGLPVREWDSPFPASLYATDGDRIVAARSPYFVQFVAEAGSEPLLWRLDTLGHPTHGIGTIHVPEVAYLAQLVNAGAVALEAGDGDAIYFAPLVRDEILKLDRAGATVWRAQRGLFRQETDPTFVSPPAGKPREVRVAHAIVNIALALGPPPDGRLYVLGAQDSAATRLRLDVLDAATGRIVTTRLLGTAQAAVAVNGRGTLRMLDPDSLLAQAPPHTRGREAFGPAFALPTLAGDTVRLADYRGKVTLVNFWASWCDPCREEFPHMAALYRDFARSQFDIAAISDDVDDGKMRAFVREFRPPFPILVGGGRMKGTYHYRGLPYSVLLDRHGRIVERIFGFGGAAEFRRLRQTIAKEIAAP
jgi:thiol-disulfide isomerase/thioredoxin